MFAIYQSKNGNGDLMLHITKTNHIEYTKNSFVAHTVEEAIEKVNLWIRGRANAS
jgi:hypothetical protein